VTLYPKVNIKITCKGVKILEIRQQWITIAFTSALVAACGGGGSSSNAVNNQPQTPINAAPAFTSAAEASVVEGGTALFDITTTDSDGDDVTLTLGGADASLFTLTGSTLSFTAAPDFETPGSAASSNTYSLTLSASDGSATTAQDVTVTVTDATEGRVIDAPLSGATVFIDLNCNLIQDGDEVAVTSDLSGYFKVPVASAAIPPCDSLKVVSIGGTDTSTGRVLPDIALVSDVPTGSNPVSITPVSTIVAAATTPAAKTAVLASLGISGSVEDFLAKDVWALAQSGDAAAQNIQKANLAISTVLQTATSLVDTSNSTTAVANATNVINAIAKQMVSQSVAGADVFDAATVATMLEQGVTEYAAVSEPTLNIATALFNSVSQSVANLIVIIESSDDVTSAAAADIATIVQGKLQTAVAAVVVSGDTAAFDTAAATTTLFSDASTAVAAIVNKDTDGDGIINTLDPDMDNDGVANAIDKFPLDRFESLDTDSDGIGNNADKDDDGDGFADAVDAFPLDATKNAFASGSSVVGLPLPQSISVLETTE
jgi:hypothetical protein